MNTYLGDYVVTTKYGHKGRVYQVHFFCPEDEQWQNGQAIPLTAAEKYEPWASILTHDADAGDSSMAGAGAVVVPMSDVTVIAPFTFRHRDAGEFFRDAHPADLAHTASVRERMLDKVNEGV